MALYAAVFACCGLFSMKPGTTEAEEREVSARPPARSRQRERSFFFRYRTFTLTLAGVVMLFAFHNITCTYMIRMMERFGGGSAEMGLALSLIHI